MIYINQPLTRPLIKQILNNNFLDQLTITIMNQETPNLSQEYSVIMAQN